jgi:hypothetical protein
MEQLVVSHSPMDQRSHFFVFAENEWADVGPYVRWGWSSDPALLRFKFPSSSFSNHLPLALTPLARSFLIDQLGFLLLLL